MILNIICREKVWAVTIGILLCCPYFLYAERVIESDQAKLIMDFPDGLNIPDGDTLRLVYIGSALDPSALLRDSSGNSSHWGGTFWSNYQVIFINPNGITFGINANIQAASFIASTLDISNDNFLYPEKYNNSSIFSKWVDKTGKPIINNGYIKVREGGQVCLLGSAVANGGTIETTLGSVVLAAGEKITLNLDTAGMISVVIDEAVKEQIFGQDGQKIDSAVKNTGTIIANGGRVVLAAKVLNQVFDYAVNNTGVIEAKALINHNGIIELVAEGAPIINSGTLETGTIKINAPTSDFINHGKLIAAAGGQIADSGNIDIKIKNILQDGLVLADTLITIDVQKLCSTKTEPAVIIQAGQVKISAKQFGTTNIPLNINGKLIHINRIDGNIEILESLGIGTSILLRGPPESFGAIIYNKDTNLTLEAQSGGIIISASAIILVNHLSLKANQDIYSLGSLIANTSINLWAKGNISSLGILRTKTLLEEGRSFTIGGVYEVNLAYVRNADNAITLNTGNYSGETLDAGNIIINNNAIITLIGNTIFRADSNQDGTGAFRMNNGSSIVGNGFDLTLYASQSSTLRAISGVGTLTINESQVGSNPLYTANIAAVNLTNLTINSGAILRIGGISSTVSGAMSIFGTLQITGRAGTKIFGTITINSGGTWNNSADEAITLRGGLINNGTFTAGSGVYTFNTNDQSIGGTNAIAIPRIIITDITLTNNGTLTVTTALAGNGTLTNGATATLSINTTNTNFTLTTLIANAPGNTVNYGRSGAQTIRALTYHNLTLSGSGIKTAAGALTVNGDLTTTDTAVFAYGAFAHNFLGNWIINSTAAAPIIATAGSTINFNTPTAPAATSLGGSTTAIIPFVNININNTSGFNLNKNISVSGTLIVTLDATLIPDAAVIISGGGTLTGYGTVQVTRTVATADFNSQYTIANKTLTNLTVEYAGTSAQTVNSITYGNIKISGLGTKTLGGAITVNGNLTIAAGATLDVSTNNYAINVGGNWSNSGTFNARSGSVTFNGTTTISGSSTTSFNNVTINSGKFLTGPASGTINVAGNWINNGTFNNNSGTVTLNGTGAQSITTGGSGSAFNILTITNSSTSGVTFEDALYTATLNAASGVKKLSFATSGTHTITSVFNINGSSGNFIELAPKIPATIWNLNAPTSTVSYVKVSYCNEVGNTVTANVSIDSGHNTNWLFTTPETSISSGPGTWITTNSTNISWTGTVAPVSPLVYSYQLDGGAWSAFDNSTAITLSGLSEGNHTFSVRAMDEAGNIDSSSAQINFGVDTTPPTMNNPFLNGTLGANGWYTSDVSATLSGNDSTSGIATIEYSYDGSTWNTYSGSFNITIEGTNSFYTRITDNVGLQTTYSPHATIKIDKTPPVINITNPVNGATYDTAQTLIYTVTDNLDSAPCVITGPASGIIYNSVGSYGILITATDSAGNSSLATLSFNLIPQPGQQSQLSNPSSLIFVPLTSQQLRQFQINPFIPMGPVYFYHPLTPVDMSAFDEFILGEEDYRFIDGAIHIVGHEGLLPFLLK